MWNGRMARRMDHMQMSAEQQRPRGTGCCSVTYMPDVSWRKTMIPMGQGHQRNDDKPFSSKSWSKE